MWHYSVKLKMLIVYWSPIPFLENVILLHNRQIFLKSQGYLKIGTHGSVDGFGQVIQIAYYTEVKVHELELQLPTWLNSKNIVQGSKACCSLTSLYTIKRIQNNVLFCLLHVHIHNNTKKPMRTINTNFQGSVYLLYRRQGIGLKHGSLGSYL